MRTKDEMLKDANTARNGYAYLKNSEDALPVRLGQDVTELFASLAEKDAEIERLNAIVDFGRVANNSHLDEIIELRRTIELWKTADSKAVAAARAETAKLYSVVESAWWQFAYVDRNGKRWCGGLSALEDMADALGLDV